MDMLSGIQEYWLQLFMLIKSLARFVICAGKIYSVVFAIFVLHD